MSDTGPSTVLVTGAGSGLGEAMAGEFAARGWMVIVTDREAARARAVAEAIIRSGGQAMDLELDVTDPEAFKAAAGRIGERFGYLDALVNNAGVAAAGSVEDTPLDDWSWVMDINLMGVVRGCRAFLPLLRASRRGHIINVASYAGLAGAPDIAAYGVSKAAVVALSESLRVELKPSNIQVSVLCPAFVKTNLLETFRSTDPSHRKRVTRWMENSGVSARDVARRVIAAVEKPRFLLLTHTNTRWFWRLKRFFPELYFRTLVRMTTRRGGDQKQKRSKPE